MIILLLASRRSREFYLLTLFLYEKDYPGTSVLEASQCQDGILIPVQTSREAKALDRQRKIPVNAGIFQRSFTLLHPGSEIIIYYFLENQNFLS
jgi:hypothetical protein